MLVGAWYIDQFGNQTREIKARDELGCLRVRMKK
jgi:hypothetical protein